MEHLTGLGTESDMTPVDMMRAMATMHNQPRLLASFVRSQLDVVAAAADKENKLARQGKVAEALKGSGVVQELAASLNRHHVLEYLPLLVEKGFTTVRAILDKDNSATLRTIEFPEAVLSDLRCEQKVHGTYHLWGNTRKTPASTGQLESNTPGGALQDPAGSIDPGESGADTTTDAVTPSNTSSSGGVRRKPQQVFSASRLQEEKFQPGESALRSSREAEPAESDADQDTFLRLVEGLGRSRVLRGCRFQGSAEPAPEKLIFKSLGTGVTVVGPDRALTLEHFVLNSAFDSTAIGWKLEEAFDSMITNFRMPSSLRRLGAVSMETTISGSRHSEDSQTLLNTSNRDYTIVRALCPIQCVYVVPDKMLLHPVFEEDLKALDALASPSTHGTQPASTESSAKAAAKAFHDMYGVEVLDGFVTIGGAYLYYRKESNDTSNQMGDHNRDRTAILEAGLTGTDTTEPGRGGTPSPNEPNKVFGFDHLAHASQNDQHDRGTKAKSTDFMVHILGPHLPAEKDLHTLEGAQQFQEQVLTKGPQYIINLRRNHAPLYRLVERQRPVFANAMKLLNKDYEERYQACEESKSKGPKLAEKLREKTDLLHDKMILERQAKDVWYKCSRRHKWRQLAHAAHSLKMAVHRLELSCKAGRDDDYGALQLVSETEELLRKDVQGLQLQWNELDEIKLLFDELWLVIDELTTPIRPGSYTEEDAR